jgi:hypothetical protein
MKAVSIYADQSVLDFLHDRRRGNSASQKIKDVVKMITSVQNELVKIFTPDELDRLTKSVGYMARIEDAQTIMDFKYEFPQMLMYKIEQFTVIELVLILDYARNKA